MTDASSSEQLLEAALRNAAGDPTRREEFLRMLLGGRVWVVGTLGEVVDGQVKAGSKVRISSFRKKDGASFVPFFTSRAELSLAVQPGTQCFAIPTRDLFEMTRGQELVLNVRGKHGKVFLPSEIAELLAHGPGAHATQHVVPAGAEVLLGQPAKRPTELLDALAKLFARRPQVSRAFLALVHVPSRDAQPNLAVGIEVEGDYQAVLREAGPLAHANVESGPVDFVEVRPGRGGIADYMLNKTQPFYVRR